MNCKTTSPNVSLDSVCSISVECRQNCSPVCPFAIVGACINPAAQIFEWAGSQTDPSGPARLFQRELSPQLLAGACVVGKGGFSSCCLRAPTHPLSFGLLQNDEGSTHEKLDFKLHFSCASYLITTPCYRWVPVLAPGRLRAWAVSLEGVTAQIHPVTYFTWLCRGSSVPCRLAEGALAARGYKLLQWNLDCAFHIYCKPIFLELGSTSLLYPDMFHGTDFTCISNKTFTVLPVLQWCFCQAPRVWRSAHEFY